MANQIQFDLASPQKLAFSKPVAMVNVPGVEGVFGVLPGHAPMDSIVSVGLVEIYENDLSAPSERFFVVGGFCEVTTESCTVMADEVIPVKNLKRDVIEDEIKNLAALEQDDAVSFKLVVAQAKLLAIA